MTESITVQRTFTSPIDRVYDAFTTAADFSVWFGTDAVEVPLSEMTWDAREGGEWSAVMHLPDGTQKHWVGTFHELSKPTRVAFDLTDEPQNPDRLTVVIDLVAAGDATAVTLTQPTPGWPEDAQVALTAGYESFFDSFERLVGRS